MEKTFFHLLGLSMILIIWVITTELNNRASLEIKKLEVKARIIEANPEFLNDNQKSQLEPQAN